MVVEYDYCIVRSKVVQNVGKVRYGDGYVVVLTWQAYGMMDQVTFLRHYVLKYNTNRQSLSE